MEEGKTCGKSRPHGHLKKSAPIYEHSCFYNSVCKPYALESGTMHTDVQQPLAKYLLPPLTTVYYE